MHLHYASKDAHYGTFQQFLVRYVTEDDDSQSPLDFFVLDELSVLHNSNF
jgi:hypothetical protein